MEINWKARWDVLENDTKRSSEDSLSENTQATTLTRKLWARYNSSLFANAQIAMIVDISDRSERRSSGAAKWMGLPGKRIAMKEGGIEGLGEVEERLNCTEPKY
jgi:hypothetical protein